MSKNHFGGINLADIKISVICITYNHKKYIRRALEGFVSQKTDFPFEIIVHDDASTDGTTDIVREFEKRYPDLIKPIYQTENLYSRGISAKYEYVLPVAKGEYIAYCEGDDCWTDENKLQIQYNYMKAHPECALCVHQCKIHDCLKNTDRYHNQDTKDRLFSLEELIPMGGGAFATNSIVMKKSAYSDIPECLQAKGFGDYQLFLNGALCGTVYYMARSMSTYNFGVEGSWTERTLFDNKIAIEHCEEVIRMLNTFNEAYNKKYDAAVQKTINRFTYEILKYKGRFFESRKEPYREFYLKDVNENGFLKVFVRDFVFRFNFLYKIYLRIKGRNK